MDCTPKYIKRAIRSMEDMAKTVDQHRYLRDFKEKASPWTHSTMISNRIKTADELFDITINAWIELEGGGAKDDKIERLIDEGDISVHYEDNKMIIYVVHTKKGCNATGEGANWCTTGSYYQHYANKGELYTIHIKGKPQEKYHLKLSLLMNMSISRTTILLVLRPKMLKLAKIFPESVFNKANKDERMEGISIISNEGTRPLGDYMNAIGLDHSEIDEEVKRDPRFILELPDEYMERRRRFGRDSRQGEIEKLLLI